ncbi:MAG: hypothetical protein Q7K54_00015 [Candidatus Parcubacteria bacterium]|nr:hypothetical protein [Candidatus Parcubacteria bacterium]
MIKRYLILILILSATFFGSSVSAQVRSTDIVLSLSPEFPNPNQNVTATIASFSTNLDKAYVSWSVNNEESSSGIGKKVFLFTTKDSNSPLSITANINTIDGQSIQKTITITPTDVDMLWEASDSYVPPFYKGKALVGSQGIFKIVAMPNLISQGQQVNMNNLSYVWTKDGDIQPNASGWGKSAFTLQNSYLDKVNEVKVTISDIAGSTTTSGTTQLFTSNPKIVFYENDFLLGTKWEKALTNGFQISPNGSTLVAEPYFFSPQNISSSNLTLEWSLNREEIKTPNPKNSLSVKPDAGQKGSALIKVVVNNIRTLFQSAEKEINVQF